jgi:hypothetical protein
MSFRLGIVWFSIKVTTLNSNFLMVYSSENILFLYLHFTWVYGSWNHQRILDFFFFWKYDSWFSSEVSKLALVRNKLIMSLNYWFMEAKMSLDHVMVPKNDQNIIERQYWLNLVREINITGHYWWKSIFFMPENVWFYGYFTEWVLTPLKETSYYIFKMTIFQKIFGDFMSHIIK